MKNKLSVIRIHEQGNPEFPSYTYEWQGPEDGIVVVSYNLLARYNDNLNDWPGFPWKMMKVKNAVFESWWMREEYVSDRIIQLDVENSRLQYLINTIYDEIGKSYTPLEAEEIRNWIRAELNNL